MSESYEDIYIRLSTENKYPTLVMLSELASRDLLSYFLRAYINSENHSFDDDNYDYVDEEEVYAIFSSRLF